MPMKKWAGLVLLGLAFLSYFPASASATPFTTLNVFSGQPGSQVQVSGGNLTPGETVDIYLGSLSNTPTASDTVRADSLWGPVTLTIPLNSISGSLVITGKGVSSSLMASNIFTVVPLTPSLVIASSTNTPGSNLHLIGTGFGANENVKISLDTASSTFLADGVGNFTGDFTIPSVTPNTYTIHATGLSSGVDAVAFVYVGGFFPNILPSSFFAHPGDTITWSGSGFAPNETVTISDATGTPLSTITTDGTGLFTNLGAIVIPFGNQNKITFTATSSVSQALIPVTISLASFIPQITPSSFFLQRGNSFLVNGTGFAPNESVSLKVRGNLLQTVPTDQNGSFTSGAFVVPLSSSSTLGILATGLSSGVTASTAITVGDIVPRAIEPATLVINLKVDNSHGGSALLGDFSVLINGANAQPNTFSFPDTTSTTTSTVSSISTSTATTTLNGDADFSITFISKDPSYAPHWEGDCNGQIVAGDIGICNITAFFSPSIAITPSTLNNGVVGSSFEQTLTIQTSATGPFTWKILSGVLPDGLALDLTATSSNTTLKGQFSKLGTFNFQISASNGVISSTQAYSVTVSLPSTIVSGGGGGGGGSVYIPSGSSNSSFQRVLNQGTSTASSVPVVINNMANLINGKLKLGDRGRDVVALQTRLKKEGFFTGPITGYFGKLTANALKAFQIKNKNTLNGTKSGVLAENTTTPKIVLDQTATTSIPNYQTASLIDQLSSLLNNLRLLFK